VPFVARLSAEIDGNAAPELASLGFTFHVQSGGEIDLEHHVATRPTTWGHVKSLFRD
jgi:hypothetical protein